MYHRIFLAYCWSQWRALSHKWFFRSIYKRFARLRPKRNALPQKKTQRKAFFSVN